MNIELIDPEPSTALTVQARAALALGSSQTRTFLAALVTRATHITEIKNDAGRQECHGAAMALVKARTKIEKTGKAAREDATAFQKAVIAEEKNLIAITAAEESRLMGLRDAWDKVIENARRAAEDAERARVLAITERIAAIKAFVGLALECRTSAMVDALRVKLNDGAHCTPSFEEFEGEALQAMQATLTRLNEIHAAKAAEESERARIKAEQAAEAERLAVIRADLDRQRAEAMERDKETARLAAIEREREQEELSKQREADAAELTRQRALLAAENARINAEREAFAREIEQRKAEAKALEPIAAPSPVTAAMAQIVEVARDAAEAAVRAPLHVVPKGPTDSEIMSFAANAVAEKFGMSTSDAYDRLASISDWYLEPATA